MKPITFSREETKAMVGEVQDYLREELDLSVGALPAELLVQFFSERMGAYFYNRGLHDAQALIERRATEMSEAIFELEQPTRHLR